jgi:hypothetical protein
MLQISCARCGRIFSADVEHIGKSLRCSGCGDAVPIVGSERQQGTAPTVRANGIPPAMPIRRQRTKPPAYRLGRFLRRKAVGSALGFCVLLALGLTSYLATRRNEPPLTSISILPPTEPPPLPPVDPPPGPNQPPEATPPPNPFGPHTKRLPKIHPITHNEGPVLPCAPSGTNTVPEGASGGHGKLKAENGSDLDVYLVVIDTATGNPVRTVSVCAHESVELTRLTEGTYRILFVSAAGYFDFNKNLSFEEIRVDNGIEYDKHTITLNPVLNGNVNVRRISRAEFVAATRMGI